MGSPSSMRTSICDFFSLYVEDSRQIPRRFSIISSEPIVVPTSIFVLRVASLHVWTAPSVYKRLNFTSIRSNRVTSCRVLLCYPMPPSRRPFNISVMHVPRPGSVALRDGTGREPDCPLIVAFEDAFSLYNPFTGKRVPAAGSGLADEYKQLPNTRLNDGRCVMPLASFAYLAADSTRR